MTELDATTGTGHSYCSFSESSSPSCSLVVIMNASASSIMHQAYLSIAIALRDMSTVAAPGRLQCLAMLQAVQQKVLLAL